MIFENLAPLTRVYFRSIQLGFTFVIFTQYERATPITWEGHLIFVDFIVIH